jgi:peptidoglycan/LPS O-acetylase OafA/YrhL
MTAAVLSTRTAAAPARSGAQPGRLDVLDGIRGWCALSVVLFHVFWETFGVLEPGFRNPLTGFLFDGRLAVSVFFVLSGEALSAAFFAGKGNSTTIRLAIKRYSRLAVPILATSLIVYVLYRSGLIFNTEAGQIVGRSDSIGGWLQFPLTLSYTLQYSLFTVFVSGDIEHAINPMLWTMKVEIFGSFLVFAIVLAWTRFSRPRMIVLAFFALSAAAPIPMANYLSCFFAGMIFADWRARGFFRARRSRFGWAPLAALCALAAGDGALRWAGENDGKCLIAVILTLAVYASPPVSAFFSGGLSRMLGRLSFPLYLVQYPVLISLTSWMIVRAGSNGPMSLAVVWGIALASVSACILAAIAFEPIETLTRRIGDGLVILATRAFPALSRTRAPAAP